MSCAYLYTLPMGSPSGVNGTVPPDKGPLVQRRIGKRKQEHVGEERGGEKRIEKKVREEAEDETDPSIPNKPSDRGMERLHHIVNTSSWKLVISIRSSNLLKLGLVAKRSALA